MKKRLKAWVVLSLSAVLCAFLGLIGCSKQPEDESVDYSPVYGAYYCELDEGEEYRLVLSQGGYMWIAAGKTETGTYRYDGDKLYFTFADTQTETSATVENNILSVTYNGSAYRLYKEIGYTVSYVADGETTSANVINGKNASKPSDPDKEGSLFVGWYSDEAYTKPYDFATPVTADVTLYACFTEGDVNDAEYTVTFISEGETLQTKQTIGGKAFDLPVPSSGDKTFVGWWVSDYQSAAKLTYKYGGEVLSADTDFYAVWAEDGYTSVSVNAEGVTWTSVGVNASYSVKITAPDGSAAATATVGSTTYAYDFASEEAGDYVVEVSVNGNTTSAYYKNKALARVTSFKVIEPSVLLFTPVENAEKYYITVDCGEEGHNHIRVDNGSSVYFNFANCAMQPGGIKFVVEAAAAGYASSVSYFTVNRELQAASNLKIDAATDEVSWNAVENAAEYIVKITTANGTDTVNVGAVTKYSLKNYAAGTVSVEVTAQTKGYNSSEAASVSYTKTSIAVPSNIKVLNNVVTWDAVSGATAYKIKVGAVEKTVTVDDADATTVSFALTNECYVNGFGTYAISVKAVAATESESSVYSEELTVSYGEGVSAVSYANGTVTWKPVSNAAGYAVKVNGVAAVTVNDGAYSAAVALTKSGVNVIDVYYIAENGNEIKWASVETYAYSVIFDARGGAAVETQYKAVGDPVALPVTESAGYDFAGWYTLPGGAANSGALYNDKSFSETTDIVLYAAWTPKDYTVQLDFGDADAGDNDTTAQVTYKRDYTVTMPVTNSDATKAFAGWYSQPNAQGTRYTDENGNSLAVWDYNENDRTFYAAWVSVFTFNEIENGNAYSVSKAADNSKEFDLFSTITVPVEYNGKPVTTVEGSAFRFSKNLVTVNIPDTVKLIETGTAFLNCTKLYNVNVYETGSNDKGAYTSVDGILIYDNANNGVELKYFPQGRSGEVVIPDVVETLPVAVFKSSSITKVTIPASVTTINSNAFYNSKKLTQVVFEAPADGTIGNALTIEENAFRNCTVLTSIDLPARLTSFDSNIFTQCSALAIVNVDGTGGAYTSKNGVLCNEDGTQIVFCPIARTGVYTISAGVNSIADKAFLGCTKLTSLVVPGYVTEIGAQAFSGCTGLVSLVFEGDKFNEKLSVGESAFYGCTKLTKVTLPENLSALAKNAFGNTQNLTEVTLNCGADIAFENAAFGSTDATPVYYVTKLNIGADLGLIDINGVFGSTTLTTVTVDNANPNYMVVDDVIFDKAVTKIVYYPISAAGEYALPATVTEIAANVFANKPISKITIGKNIVSIGDYAFANSKNLATVEFEDGGTENLVIGANAFTGTAITQIALPARVTEFGESAFANCSALTTATIPAVQTVPTAAFKGCVKLATVTVSEGVQTISNEAFASCTALTSFSIPSSVTSLELNADNILGVFTDCTKLAAVNIAADNAKYASVDGIIYEKNASGEKSTLLFCPSANTPNAGETNEGVFAIPAEVTYVASGAFAQNKGIKKVEFAGETAENFRFGNKVFDGCTALQEVKLPKGLTEIGEEMFANCTSITHVYIPNTVSIIKNMAFYKCSSLAQIEFEEGNTSNPLEIADGKEVIINSRSHYQGVFVGCKALTTVTLPERTTKIGAYAFSITDASGDPTSDERKNGITTLNVPSTVKTIGNYAFLYTRLQTVNFAENSQLTEIGESAFCSDSSIAKLTSLELPASLEKIGIGAFEACTALTTVTVKSPSKLKTIDDGAFYQCTQLTAFTVPASVTRIGESAFQGASALASVTFETDSSIEVISTYAFASSGLTSFTFPELNGENKIILGDTIFNGCSRLTTVVISKSITNPAKALLGCSTITTINLTDGAPVKLVDDGLYSADGKEVYYVFATAEGEYTIPDGVEIIGSYVFDGKKKITKVIIPASVREIGDYAFRSCSAMTEIEFKDESKLEKIGISAFQSCSKLTSISIPNGVTEIGKNAFRSCSKLASVDLPASLTTVGTYTFSSCSALTSIVIPAQLTSISSNMFASCSKLATVTFMETTALTSIGSSAFSGCKALTKIEIPDSVVSIGGSTLDANGFTSSSGQAFRNCSALEEVKLPSGLTVIPNYSFENCAKLKSINIPDGVIAIGGGVFTGCAVLDHVTIPAGVKFGNGQLNNPYTNSVFSGCVALSDVVFKGDVNYLGYRFFYGCTSLKSISLKGVPMIGQEAFKGCTSLSLVTLEGVLSIEQSAFSNCIALKSIDLPDSLESIGFSAFSNSAIEELTIPANVSSITNGAFIGCTNLTQVAIDERNIYYRSTGENIIYDMLNRLIYCPISTSGEVVMEDDSTLAAYAFYGCINITNVVLSDSVTAIPDNAFGGCSSLVGITLPETVKSIGNSVFDGCVKLESINIPAGVDKIGDYVFRNCLALTKIELPDTVTSIGSYAFFGCSELTSITLSSNITSIGSYALYGCSKLTEIELPSALTTIGSAAFRNCTSLKSIVIPDGVTLINSYVFDGCSSLESVKLSSSLTGIAAQAFSGCTALKSIVLPDTVTKLVATTFNGCTITVHVPYASESELPADLKPLITTTSATITVVYDKALTE